MNYLTAETLIDSVKNRAMIPENQATFTTDNFLQLANDELIIGLVPSVLIYHEDYLLYSQTIALEDGKSSYKIPYRAIGNKLRDLTYQDTSGNIYGMARIQIEQVPDFQGVGFVNNNFAHYYVRNNEIVIVPEVSESVVGNLIFSYYIRPNNLVVASRTAEVTAIDRDTGEITVDGIPTGFSTTTKLDFIKVENPFKTLFFDKTPTAINSTTKILTFDTDDIPDDLEAGDNINFASETNIIQLPADLHVVLAQRTAARCLEALGDTQGIQNANQKLADMDAKIPSLIDNRVESSPIKISNRWGMARISSLRRGRWGG